jgi:adenine-specific DNA-methyltransferase
MSLESAYFAVKELVDNFKANESRYLSKEYQEAEARKDFIDKFFIALGWDVNHDTQKNPYEQEVKVEKGMFIGKGKKRADYTFALAPNYRDPKFIAEAKKPQRNLSNLDDYFQTVKYGWNTNNPVAVLTDFEEFHIIDSRFKPVISVILERKIQSFHYSEYLDKEKFAKIYYLFSREAVGDGSIEKFAETLPKPRGKAVQKGLFAGAFKTVDELFLDELDNVRETLARSFKRRNQNLDSEELTEAVQRTIDRLVFIRFLEDKLIEGEHHISSYGEKNSAWKDFISDCRGLDAKYNGIVFKKHLIDNLPPAPTQTERLLKDTSFLYYQGDEKQADNLINQTAPSSGQKNKRDEEIVIQGEGAKGYFNQPDDADFGAVCEELSDLNSPYDFNAIPIHILGSIYERFLGKIVKTTAKRVTIEEKPEVRKAGGVYYTPQYIVKYIVDNTVGKILNGEASPLLKGARGMDQGLTPKQISKLRFADISCGSGSFLITVFDTLLQYHGKWYQEHPEQAKKDGCILKEGQWYLSLKQKRDILVNNVYGVDIDYQAVEVTQVSLFLKLLEDVTLSSANEMQVLFKEKILPDLSKNIVCGNSLIDMDILEGQLFDFNEEKKLNSFNFNNAFPFIKTNNGFDAVIGNPPWGQKAVEFSSTEKKYLAQHYPTSSQGILDLFRFFIEKALKLIKENGYWGYVLPDIILLKNYDSTRKLLLDKLKIDDIQYWGMAFKNVNIDTCSIIGSINEKEKNNLIDIAIHNAKKEIVYNKIIQKKFYKLSGYKFNIYLDESTESLLNELNKNNKFEDFFEVHEGIHSGNIRDKLFISSRINDNCKKLIFGRDEIKRYNLKWNGKWVDYRKDIVDKKAGEYAGLGKKEYFEINKIVVRRTGDFILAALDTNNYYFSNNAFVCIPKININLDLKYVVGLLNSDLMTWYYLTIQPRKGKLFSELKINQLRTFPIRAINLENNDEVLIYNKIIEYVDCLMQARIENNDTVSDRKVEYFNNKKIYFENEINTLVYKLYNFSDNNIEIIKNFNNKEKQNAIK